MGSRIRARGFVLWLLEAGANPDILDAGKKTAIVRASEMKRWDVIKVLLEHSANPNIEGDCKKPLISATRSGHLDIVRILIGNQARVDAEDSEGWTALLHAAERGHDSTAKLLTEQQADANHTSKNGRKALMRATESGHIGV